MIGARQLAYQILLNIARNVSHPDRLIRTMLDRHSLLEDRDRALLTELVYGVLRWQGRLDWHIDLLSKVKPSRIDPAVRILLRLSLYQILFLDRIPSHAAVNEAVKIAKSTQPAHLAGFVNAVLREAIRRNGHWSLPTSENDPPEYLAVTTSHPRWLAQRYLKELGLAEAERLCEANNQIAPMVLRVNSLKATATRVMEWLRENGFEVEPSPYLPDAVRAHGLRHDVARFPIYESGWIQVQDEASQLVSHLMSPRPGERVLDLCSGFGGKATHQAILLGNEGEILAVDRSAWKLEELRQNAERQGARIISVLDGDVLELLPEQLGTFDRVLLDAPCSGFGSLRRNPDIKWRRNLKDPYRFGTLQKGLLQRASSFVKTGGVLVYATCTLFAEENEEVANHFMESSPGWELEAAGQYLPESCKSMTEGPFLKTWPHRHGIDGFFGARWRRKE